MPTDDANGVTPPKGRRERRPAVIITDTEAAVSPSNNDFEADGGVPPRQDKRGKRSISFGQSKTLGSSLTDTTLGEYEYNATPYGGDDSTPGDYVTPYGGDDTTPGGYEYNATPYGGDDTTPEHDAQPLVFTIPNRVQQLDNVREYQEVLVLQPTYDTYLTALQWGVACDLLFGSGADQWAPFPVRIKDADGFVRRHGALTKLNEREYSYDGLGRITVDKDRLTFVGGVSVEIDSASHTKDEQAEFAQLSATVAGNPVIIRYALLDGASPPEFDATNHVFHVPAASMDALALAVVRARWPVDAPYRCVAPRLLASMMMQTADNKLWQVTVVERVPGAPLAEHVSPGTIEWLGRAVLDMESIGVSSMYNAVHTAYVGHNMIWQSCFYGARLAGAECRNSLGNAFSNVRIGPYKDSSQVPWLDESDVRFAYAMSWNYQRRQFVQVPQKTAEGQWLLPFVAMRDNAALYTFEHMRAMFVDGDLFADVPTNNQLIQRDQSYNDASAFEYSWYGLAALRELVQSVAREEGVRQMLDTNAENPTLFHVLLFGFYASDMSRNWSLHHLVPVYAAGVALWRNKPDELQNIIEHLATDVDALIVNKILQALMPAVTMREANDVPTTVEFTQQIHKLLAMSQSVDIDAAAVCGELADNEGVQATLWAAGDRLLV